MGTHFGSLGSKEQNGDPGIPNIFRLSFRKSKKHNGDPDIPKAGGIPKVVKIGNDEHV